MVVGQAGVEVGGAFRVDDGFLAHESYSIDCRENKEECEDDVGQELRDPGALPAPESGSGGTGREANAKREN